MPRFAGSVRVGDGCIAKHRNAAQDVHVPMRTGGDGFYLEQNFVGRNYGHRAFGPDGFFRREDVESVHHQSSITPRTGSVLASMSAHALAASSTGKWCVMSGSMCKWPAPIIRKVSSIRARVQPDTRCTVISL